MRQGVALLGAAVSLAVVGFALGACSSSVDPRDIQQQCSVESGAVLLDDTPSNAHQIGIVGDHVFVSFEASNVEPWPWTGRWHRLDDLGPAGPDIDLGWGPSRRPLWVADEGLLEGFTVTDPEHRDFTLPVDRVTWWRHAPPPMEMHESSSVDMPSHDVLTATLALGASGSEAGPQGTYPAASVAGQVFGVIGVVPEVCIEPLLSSLRPHFFSYSSHPRVALWTDPCASMADQDEETLAPWLVDLEDGFGLFYRPAKSVPMPVRYVRLNSDLEVMAGPSIVGLTREAKNSFNAGGHQVRAVRLGDTVLFAEGTRRADWCQALTLMSLDGSNVRRAPWQLPCVDDASTIVSAIEMTQAGDYAALLWSERSRNGELPGGSEELEVIAGAEWWVDVKFALLTREGKLASEPVSVVEPESTSLLPIPRTSTGGPPPEGFRISLATSDVDGGLHAAAWTDLRADAPGLYGRSVRCEPMLDHR